MTAQAETQFWTAHGWDKVDCLIATNPGEPMKPLDEIASGGEMSRVMLALKVTVEEGGAAPVGGRRRRCCHGRWCLMRSISASAGGRPRLSGKKLKTLSKGQQVLCITHLPQIAAFGDQHFLIEKTVRQGRTQTEIRLMEAPQRMRGDCPDAERGEADRYQSEACGASDRDEPVAASRLDRGASYAGCTQGAPEVIRWRTRDARTRRATALRRRASGIARTIAADAKQMTELRCGCNHPECASAGL